MLGKAFDKLLHEDEEEIHKSIRKVNKQVKKEAEPTPFNITGFLWGLGVFLFALATRLIYLYKFQDPHVVGIDWYGDVYHHWQVAIFTRDVGFHEGFLRLWDLKGLEYYWGLLHPLSLITGFSLLGTTDIIVPRLVGSFFSAAAITMLFLIIKRHFNILSALAAVVLAALMPVNLFSDTLGMQEPLGLFLLRSGIYFWPKHAFWTGAFWMMAGMVRSEYWLFGLGMTGAVLLRGRNSQKKLFLGLGYGLFLLFYMKYMLDYTGNPIYPIYYNFAATVRGDWFIKDIELSTKVQFLQSAFKILAVFVITSGLAILWKRPKGYLLYLVGLSNIAFLSYVFGFGSYLYGYPEDGLTYIIDRNFVDRLMSWPYMFIGALLSIVLLYYVPKVLPKKLKMAGTVFGLLALAGALGITQLAWPSIEFHYDKAMGPVAGQMAFGKKLADYYDGGAIIKPAGKPAITYSMIQNGIPTKEIISQQYDPFFYYGEDAANADEGDPFLNWDEFREEIHDWFEKEDAKMFVIDGEKVETYNRMVELEPEWFTLLEESSTYKIYEITI